MVVKDKAHGGFDFSPKTEKQQHKCASIVVFGTPCNALSLKQTVKTWNFVQVCFVHLGRSTQIYPWRHRQVGYVTVSRVTTKSKRIPTAWLKGKIGLVST